MGGNGFRVLECECFSSFETPALACARRAPQDEQKVLTHPEVPRSGLEGCVVLYPERAWRVEGLGMTKWLIEPQSPYMVAN